MIQFDEQYVSNGLKPPTRQENGVLTMLPGSLWSLTAVDRIRCSVPKNCHVVACFCLILFPLELVHMENSKTMLTYRYDLMYIYIYVEYMDRHMQSRHKKSEFHLELDSVPCLDLGPLYRSFFTSYFKAYIAGHV